MNLRWVARAKTLWTEAQRPLLILSVTGGLALAVNALRFDGLPLVHAVRAGAGVIDLNTLRQRLAQGTAVFVDSRSPHAFALGHLPGALNIPSEPKLQYLPRVFEWLSPEDFIIIYCDDRNCPFARDLAATLLENGFNPARLRIFEPGWQALRRLPEVRSSEGAR